MLQWLGGEIADDPRFIRATMRTLYKGIIGQDLLPAPGDSASDAVKQAFNAQRGVINKIGQAMVADNWNIKTAVKGLILSPYYRASTVDTEVVQSHDHIGGSQFLSPELIQKKLQNIFGHGWDDLNDNEVDNRTMMGGMDSDTITTRITNPNGLMVAIQERMANEMACRATAFDFTRTRSPSRNDRKLFPYVSLETVPLDGDGFELTSNVANIKKNIQYLHWAILAEEVALDSAELTATYNLFLDIWKKGNHIMANPDDFEPNLSTSLDWRCRARDIYELDGENSNQDLPSDQQITNDADYVIRSWMAVITYLLTDYRFIYE